MVASEVQVDIGGGGGAKIKNITEREVQHWNTLLRVPMDTPSLEPSLDMA